jgi:hypothetical protein
VNRSQLQALQHRIDALRRRCTTGYGCGSTCISLRKECRTSPGSSIGKERLKRLLALAAGGKVAQRGIAPVRAQEAGKIAVGIGQRRGEKAQQLKGKRAESGLIPTALPFSDAVAARIKKGIIERTIRTGAVNYGGEELADALLKVAQAPGGAGENARQALAFMEEAGIMVNVAAVDKNEILRVTGKTTGTSEIPWNDGRKLAKMVVDMGLVSDERMEWMRKDNTDAGRSMVRSAELVRNPSMLKPQPEELRAKERLAAHLADLEKANSDFDRGIAQGWRFEEDRKNSEISYYSTNVSNARKTYKELKESRLNELKRAAQDLITSNVKGLANETSGGFYQFGQKAYVAQAGVTGWAGDKKVAASETDPTNIRRAYSTHMAKHLPDRLGDLDDKDRDSFAIRVHPIGYTNRLSNGEQALGVHIHELGHVVDNFAGVRLRSDLPGKTASGVRRTVLMTELGSERQRSTPAAVADSLRQKRGPSNYSLTNREELFAESFAAWVFAPRALKQHHPALHDWVESRVRQARRTMAKHGKLPFDERAW